MMIDVEELMRRLEEIGEVKVREYLASGVYGPKERHIVEEWLSSKERKEVRRREEEYLRIAISAKRAAWMSTIAALVSALAAIAAWLW